MRKNCSSDREKLEAEGKIYKKKRLEKRMKTQEIIIISYLIKSFRIKSYVRSYAENFDFLQKKDSNLEILEIC